MHKSRSIDRTLLKVSLVAMPLVITLVWALSSWPLLAVTVLSVYGLALASSVYRLSEYFVRRNSVDNFVIREQGQLRVCSLAGFFDLRGEWQSVALGDIKRVEVDDHVISIRTQEEDLTLSVVGSAQEVLDYMCSVLSDTSVTVMLKERE
ncbi:hypothetical protein [Pseudoalteromonas sp. GB56]